MKQTCPNCPGAETRHVFTVRDRRVVACRSCGVEFVAEYPEIADADERIYGPDYFRDAIARARERKPIFRELVAQVQSEVGHAGRLLDVGAGEGALMEAAVEMGWEAVGTDISSAMVEHVRGDLGLDMRQGELESIDLEPRSFDAVILNHVLEHVRDPRSTLERVRDLLTDGGVARVEVPNLAGLSSRGKNLQSRLRLKSNPWKHYATGHHFWFFRPRTLRLVLEHAGLEVRRLSAPARQWGRKSTTQGVANSLYDKMLWGGHLVAFASRR